MVTRIFVSFKQQLEWKVIEDVTGADSLLEALVEDGLTATLRWVQASIDTFTTNNTTQEWIIIWGPA